VLDLGQLSYHIANVGAAEMVAGDISQTMLALHYVPKYRDLVKRMTQRLARRGACLFDRASDHTARLPGEGWIADADGERVG
jgi:hypothetical protein